MKLNIITSVYNGESTVASAIESAQGLDERLCTHWVIDDGSSDQSREVIRAGLRDTDQFVENVKNIGACASRNKILDMLPDDELVMNLDQDDRINADAIRSIWSMLDAKFIMVGDVIRIDSVGKSVLENRVFNRFVGRFAQKKLQLLSIIFWPPRIGAVIIPVGHLKQIGGFGPTRYGGEDWVVFYRLLGKGVPFYRAGKVFAYRYVGASNESIRNRRARLRNWYKIAKREIDTIPQKLLLLLSYIYKVIRS